MEVSSAEVSPAPELESTVDPISEVQTPEEAKTFTQDELDAAIGKRLAREQRKWEREQRVAPPSVPVAPPQADQFESQDAYVDALATQRAQELVARQREQQDHATILDAYHEKEEEVRAKYDDFEQVAYNPNLRITSVMAQTIQASDIGPEVAYHLGANPKEADRISRLSPYLQAKEIGSLEARLQANPPVKKTTTAPAPIAPVNARGSNSASYDTTDPRSMKMSMAEWAAADAARIRKKWDAQNR